MDKSEDLEKKILQAQSGDVESLEDILRAFKRLALGYARQFYLVGGGEDDLVQEGMLGLLKAIKTYRHDTGVAFEGFARRCVKNAVIDAVRGAVRNKHRPLNDYVTLDEQTQTVDSLEDIAIEREEKELLSNLFESCLNDKEKRILTAYLEGFTYAEIALSEGTAVKAVDNAIQRIKKKLSEGAK